MKIIISPAKKMRVQTDIMEETGMPVFLEDAKQLHGLLKEYSMEQLGKLFGANEAITRQNYERYQTMDSVPVHGSRYFYRLPMGLCKRSSADTERILRCFKGMRRRRSIQAGDAGQASRRWEQGSVWFLGKPHL